MKIKKKKDKRIKRRATTTKTRRKADWVVVMNDYYLYGVREIVLEDSVSCQGCKYWYK